MDLGGLLRRTSRLNLARRADPPPHREPAGGMLHYLSAPEDLASIVFFRVALGAIIFWEVLSFAIEGLIGDLYVKPLVHFTYLGFDWVRPLPAPLMYGHFVLVAALALCVMLGFWYRVTSVLFFIAWTYVFLVQRAYFHSYYYLIAMLGLLMVFAPAHRMLSLDVARNPQLRSEVGPRWILWLLRLQVGVVYFYGGVCKLNADWLQGAPMRQVLAAQAETPLVSPLFREEWMVYVFSYGGLFLDLFIAPLLLWRRTRVVAFVMAVLFHVTNATFWDIGIFPAVMIAATTLFLSPNWPRKVAGLVKGSTPRPRRRERKSAQAAEAPPWTTLRQWQLGLIAIYAAVQLIVPLQPFLYPGNVSWTGEGERFSWQLRAKSKEARAKFYLTDPVRGTTRPQEVALDDHLLPWQIGRMSFQPDMILQFAHYLHQHTLETEGVAPEVRAHVKTSLNARRPQLLVDPTVDLAAEPRTLRPADWIMPLRETLPPAEDQRDAKYREGFGRETIVFATGPTVSDQQIEDNLARLLADPDLAAVHLCHASISDRGLVHLGRLKQLTTLDLADTDVTDAGLGHLRGLEDLLVLNLRGTKVTDAGVETLQKALPGLRITR